MFIRHILFSLIAFAFVTDLRAYDPEAAAPKGIKRIGKQSWGQLKEGWRLALAFPKDVYGTNEWVTGAALLRNETDLSRPLVINSDGEGDYSATVTDEWGRIVPKQNEGLAAFFNMHSTSVAGHSDHARTTVISLFHNVTTPGIYRISISRRVSGFNGTSQVVVSSATNIIRVLNTDHTGTNGDVLNFSNPKP
jgi:hypothetical protein